jgi:hypothetical protein
MRIANILGGNILCLILILTSGCEPPGISSKWEYQELFRLPSPDSLVEAVLISGNGGATTRLVFQVYIIDAGAKLDVKSDDNAVFTADYTNNVRMNWKANRLLEISYEEARIHNFKNFWEPLNPEKAGLVVEIRLKPDKDDFSLPIRYRNSVD